MTTERFVVAGVALARTPWFGELARLATTGALPLEFIKCVSVEELRARLDGSRRWSAVLVDGHLPSADRDLIDLARSQACAVVVVDDERATRDWNALGAAAVLAPGFSRSELMDVLEAVAVPVQRGDLTTTAVPRVALLETSGRLVAVTGPGGTGTSTLASALAQGLGRSGQDVVLADMALDADQALLHGTPDVIPGLPELVDAHRAGVPTSDDVRSLLFDIVERRYQLLLGLRRHRDWAALRPRALEASLASLRATFEVTVIDVDCDAEGHAETGSVEVEDRNLIARTVFAGADLVVVVGRPGLQGVHALCRTIASLVAARVEPQRLLPVINDAPRSPRARAELTRTISGLCAPTVGRASDLAPPLFVGLRRQVEHAHRDATALPKTLSTPLADAVRAALARTAQAVEFTGEPEPELVLPGSLGSWSDDD
ncbi:MAG: hypothetical protein JWL70_1400 [Acidimicrobiia bacterium]|nr:hypothetical protein [Acidimicrobiia bacterium]